MPSRPRNRTAYSLLIGIILLASIGYVCGFVALWIRPENPTVVVNPLQPQFLWCCSQRRLLGELPAQVLTPTDVLSA
ncbi:MAG: hypothetical protein HC853_08190, partial [Anaerolineae bacterium]|nr:hypothetical protein [Anaerolineae bacterium]